MSSLACAFAIAWGREWFHHRTSSGLETAGNTTATVIPCLRKKLGRFASVNSWICFGLSILMWFSNLGTIWYPPPLWRTKTIHSMDLCLFNGGFHKSPTIPIPWRLCQAPLWIANFFNPRPRRFEGGRPVPYQILASDDEKVLGHLKRLLACKNHWSPPCELGTVNNPCNRKLRTTQLEIEMHFAYCFLLHYTFEFDFSS